MRTLFLLMFFVASFSLEAFAQKFSTNNRVPQYLETYQVGGRPQRVRFYVSNKAQVDLEGAENEPDTSYRKMYRDQLAASGSTAFARLVTPITNAESFLGEKSTYYGLAVSPSVIICASNLLQQLKKVSVDLKEAYAKWAIDEINIFIYATSKPSVEQYKLEIAPVPEVKRDPALNIQIPLVVPSGECLLPSDSDLHAAILDAAKL